MQCWRACERATTAEISTKLKSDAPPAKREGQTASYKSACLNVALAHGLNPWSVQLVLRFQKVIQEQCSNSNLLVRNVPGYGFPRSNFHRLSFLSFIYIPFLNVSCAPSPPPVHLVFLALFEEAARLIGSAIPFAASKISELSMRGNLGEVLRAKGDVEQAEVVLRAAVEGQREQGVHDDQVRGARTNKHGLVEMKRLWEPTCAKGTTRPTIGGPNNTWAFGYACA